MSPVAERLDIRSNVKVGGFLSQLEASSVATRTEIAKQPVCRCIYI